MADCRRPPSCNVAKTRSSKCTTTTTTTTEVRGMDSITTWLCSCSRRRHRRCCSCCCSCSTLKRRSFRPCNRRGRNVYTDCCHNRLQLFLIAKQSKLSSFVMRKETTTTTRSWMMMAVIVLGLLSQVFVQLGNNQKGGFVALDDPNTSAKPKKLSYFIGECNSQFRIASAGTHSSARFSQNGTHRSHKSPRNLDQNLMLPDVPSTR